eukprot:474044_1
MSLDKVTSALLQDEGRGWKIGLFINDNIKMEYVCDYCNNLCRNAVELSCDVDHDDDTIQLYCESCLKEVIASNNNTCPINNHSNPTYTSIRRIRGKINKSEVLCPNSVVYKQQKSKEKNVAKGNIMVETSDEKEGINPNENDNNNEVKGCDFKGNLSQLINHISKCCESNLDSELQAEVIKVLRNDINELKKNNQHIQNTLTIQNNIIDQLKKQNQNLVQKCNGISEENKQQIDKSQNKMSIELRNGIDSLRNDLKTQNANLLKQYKDMSQKFVIMSQQHEQQKDRINKLENIVKESKEEKSDKFAAYQNLKCCVCSAQSNGNMIICVYGQNDSSTRNDEYARDGYSAACPTHASLIGQMSYFKSRAT